MPLPWHMTVQCNHSNHSGCRSIDNDEGNYSFGYVLISSAESLAPVLLLGHLLRLVCIQLFPVLPLKHLVLSIHGWHNYTTAVIAVWSSFARLVGLVELTFDTLAVDFWRLFYLVFVLFVLFCLTLTLFVSHSHIYTPP